jgi:hypothetical protein
MFSAKLSSRGFTLVAALLLTMLLSGVAIALLMMVTNEQRSGGADLSNNYTYRSAEGAMEKMTSDLANTFQSIQAPTTTDICNVGNNPPTYDPTVSFTCSGCLYSVAPVNPATTTPCSSPLPPPVWGQVASGADQGLYAQIIPVSLNVIAQRMDGAETVSMTRTAEVALIPVFQYGVFSDSDLFYGQSPNLGFAGRVHTNGDLYLGVANGYSLVFGDKLSAFGNVIREQMDDGMVVGGGLDDGTVLIPTASNGCSTQLAALFSGGSVNASATCVNIDTGYGSSPGLGTTNGSVVGGHGSAQNTATWQNVSLGTYNSYLIDGNGVAGGTADGTNSTGATDLTLPFVNASSGATAIQIIRRPLSTTTPTSLLGGSQLAYEAQIRVLLSDTQTNLHLPDWNGDLTGDVQLVGVLPTALASLNQGSMGGGSQAGPVQVTGGGTSGHYYYFGESWCAGSSAIGTGYAAGSTCPSAADNNFVIPPYYGNPSPWSSIQSFPAVNSTNFPSAQTGTGTNAGLEWPLVGGWLRVEAKWNDGVWHPVTNEWLQLGFARGVNPPQKPGYNCTTPTTNYLATAPGCNFLPDHKNAILYFQMTKDSNVVGTPSTTADYPLTGAGLYYDTSTATYKSQYNWYPLNLYDAREGENYDVASTFTQGTGTPNGIMNEVELDVGNLRNWLLGLTGTTGSNVNYTTQNGYILYFSDRRGMQFATTAQGANYQYQWGEYGYEDTVNYANIGNKLEPDGALDPVNYNGVSPEDVNSNGVLDYYGVKGVGDAYGTNLTSDTDTMTHPSPFAQRLGTSERVPLTSAGVANRVTGARHALKLVDGSLGQLPTMPPGNSYNNCSQTAANPTACGGFTVGSENPVYIFGNYNTNCPSASAAGCTTTNATYDATWSSTTAAESPHAAASVIADAVTLLSNNWRDVGCVSGSSTTYCPTSGANAVQAYSGSMVNNINPGSGATQATPNRFAVTSYYRVAIAGGKTIAFDDTTGTPDAYFGMDGGVHNFLRQLEDWSGSPNSAGPQGGLQSLYYKGSIVSLYWNAYATGTWKCCNLVYHPPNRQYNFDNLFAIPANLPPGTPMFRNVDNLSYRQNQIARQN